MIIFAFVLLLLYAISFSKFINHNRAKITLNSFNVAAIEPLKGLLALMVIFCHIVPYVKFGVLGELGNYGPIAVGMFFFISGYGLLKSLLCKDGYLQHFLSKRFSKLIPPITIVTLCFISLETEWEREKLVDILSLLAEGNTLTPYAWYVYVILLYYILFYIIFKLIKTIVR